MSSNTVNSIETAAPPATLASPLELACGVTLTNRIDLFDERETNNRAVNIVVPANGRTTVQTRWCSSNRAAHTAQTRWTGTDASGRSISVLGPRVTLTAAP